MHFRSVFALAALLAAPATAAVSTNAAGSFNLLSIDPAPGSLWALNRAATFVFDQPVDLGTVNPNTIQIFDNGGSPARGVFFLSGPNTVLFQPDCPLEPDYSDAGFAPATPYAIVVPDNASGAPTVASTSGLTLDTGGISTFATPDSDDPAVLFDDTVAGPPTVVVRPQGSSAVNASYLELAGDPTFRVYFERDTAGNVVLPPGFETSLNLYTVPTTAVAVVVELDQSVSPSVQNLARERVRLEYLEPGRGWRAIACETQLVGNCADLNVTLRLEPRGVLPQGRSVRVNVTAGFSDLVGEVTSAAQQELVFQVTSATDTGGIPLELGDERDEAFLLAGDDEGSLEDAETILPTPRAAWGGGVLRAASGFAGTGGPGGDFDWYVPANTIFVLDTISAQIIGGPGGVPTTVQNVVNGVVDLRDLFIPATSQVIVQGPNPLTLWATGEVRIDGLLTVNGGNAQPVFSLNQPFIPELGAPGQGGGGRGGTGSWRITTSTERGGPGFGAFDAPALGGEGGESGWHPSPANNGELHRGAGGGGGVFGQDVLVASGPVGAPCVDQSLVGLDAESGFPGATQAMSGVDSSHIPWGGHVAPSPFTDGDDSNDFWGVMRFRYGTRDERLVQGELTQPWAGAGGGGGGDGTIASVYPPPNLINHNEDKGAGGGGGAGAIEINAIGAVVFGPSGRVEARGGHGSGGENTFFVNRVGGGSGGGSGGHVIVQSLTGVDFSQVPAGSTAILARGGQGGAGAANTGGADFVETSPPADAKHVGGDPGGVLDNPWIPPVPTECQYGLGVVRGAGGDGGPGLVQLHVPESDDILTSSGSLAELRQLSMPPPVGFSGPSAGPGTLVDGLLPTFGPVSVGLSRWIALGEASVAPGTPAPDPIEFLFGGTDPNDPNTPGRVVTNAGQVPPLAPLVTGGPLSFSPQLPYITPDGRTLIVDGADFAGPNELYLRNPALLREYGLRLSNAPTEMSFDLAFAFYYPASNELGLTVPSSGPKLTDYPAWQGSSYAVIPRYFRALTDGLFDFLPVGTTTQIEFQAAPADKLGRPDVARLFPGPSSTQDWTADVEDFNQAAANAQFRYYRFRVTFDLAAGGAPFDPAGSAPALDFLRLPFRF